MGYHQYTSYSLQLGNPLAFATMNDSTNYFFSMGQVSTSVSIARIYIPRKGIIRYVNVSWYHATTDCSTEDTTVAIRKNDTTDATIFTGSLANANSPQIVTNLNLPVEVGDFITVKISTPHWATNPQASYFRCALEVQC